MKYQLGASLLMSASVVVQAEETIKICGDAIDWPPYTYLTRDGVKGVDADILQRALKPNDIPYQLSVTSWSRCLRDAALGKYQVAVSATYSDKRARSFYYTDWYYEITPYYLYSRTTFPEGLDITSVSDLNQYKICGIHGYNYTDFGLDGISQTNLTVSDALKEVMLNRCDIFLSWKEILQALDKMDQVDFNRYAIIAAPVPSMKKHKFYMLISKAYPQGEVLLELLNNELMKLRHSGQLDLIIRQYLED